MSDTTTHADVRRWGFLITEAVLIVASILLAFALDSRWDERKNRVEDGEILRGLVQEFARGRETLLHRTDQHYASMVEARDHTTGEYETAVAALDDILAEIERSLAALEE